jgi:hypothetical protein
MKYAMEMGSGAMIEIPIFIKLAQAFKSLQEGFTDTQIHRGHGDCISLFSLFQNEESRLKILFKLQARL